MEIENYGTVESEHVAVCQCCEETKVTRVFLTLEGRVVNVCAECYMNEKPLKL